jgi:hypothetical protein
VEASIASCWNPFPQKSYGYKACLPLINFNAGVSVVTNNPMHSCWSNVPLSVNGSVLEHWIWCHIRIPFLPNWNRPFIVLLFMYPWFCWMHDPDHFPSSSPHIYLYFISTFLCKPGSLISPLSLLRGHQISPLRAIAIFKLVSH